MIMIIGKSLKAFYVFPVFAMHCVENVKRLYACDDKLSILGGRQGRKGGRKSPTAEAHCP